MGWGWSDKHVDEHEKGHENVAKALGWKTRRRGNSTEMVAGPDLRPAEYAAIAYGGKARAGSGGHSGDDRIAEEYLRRLPASQRGAARREAKRIARRYA